MTVTLAQSGRALGGTAELSDPAMGGVFDLRGRTRRARVRLVGRNGLGAVLVWTGSVRGSGLYGRAELRLTHRRLHGRLLLARRDGGPLPDPACDDVFTQNVAFFERDVMGTVLVPICASCHVAGGIAQATRLRVTPGDPLATSRSVATLIDRTSPASSRVLEKPLARIAHGGGQQLVDGSEPARILAHWVDLVAQSPCGASPPGDGGSGPKEPIALYDRECASCHGPDARGTGLAPSIRCHRSIHDTVRSGRTGAIGTMPAFASLSEGDIAGLQDRLDALCAAGGTAGSELFASNCALCHGADAAGTGVAPNVRCATRVREAVRFGRGSLMPAVPLLPADLPAVEQYLDGLCEAAGASGADLYTGNCASCHGPTGAGGRDVFGVSGGSIRCAGRNDFVEKVTRGDGQMPAFPRLSLPRIDRIVAYVAGYCAGGDD